MSKVQDKKISTEALIGQLSEELTLTQRICSPVLRILPWMVFSVLYLAVVCYLSGIRHDFDNVVKELPFVFEIGLVFALFVSAAVGSAYLALPDQGQKYWVKIVPLTLLGVGLFWSLARGYAEGFMMPAKIWYHCSEYGLILEALPIIAIVLMLSMRGHTTQPGWLYVYECDRLLHHWDGLGLRLTCADG